MLRGPCMAPYAKADAKRAPRASLVRWPRAKVTTFYPPLRPLPPPSPLI